MKRHPVAILLSFLFLPLILHARSEKHFDRTLQVSGAVSVDVETGSGDITVKTGSSNQVVVHGTIRNSNWLFSNESALHQVESNPPIQQSGSSIRIGYNLPDDVRRHVSIDYDITVPAQTSLQAQSGSGNVEVAGVHSQVQLQTGSGDIRMHDLGSGVKAQTSSGNI